MHICGELVRITRPCTDEIQTMSIITLITDFGTQDYYVGAMKGVIMSMSPDAQLVDISHSIRPHDEVHGAFVLGQVWSKFPVGTVHLVVIDPDVGSERKIVVGRCEGRYFVTPDNARADLADALVPAATARVVASRTVARTFERRRARRTDGTRTCACAA